MTPLVVVDGRCSSISVGHMLQGGTKQIGSSFCESIGEALLKGGTLSRSFLPCFMKGVDLTRRKKALEPRRLMGSL